MHAVGLAVVRVANRAGDHLRGNVHGDDLGSIFRREVPVELGAIVSYKGRRYEVIMYMVVGNAVTALELRNEYETIKLRGERQCRNARLVR